MIVSNAIVTLFKHIMIRNYAIELESITHFIELANTMRLQSLAKGELCFEHIKISCDVCWLNKYERGENVLFGVSTLDAIRVSMISILIYFPFFRCL